MGWTLSIDFGTTNTAAAYALEGQTPRHVRFSSGDTMPSAVLAGESGTVVGVHATRSRRLRPESYLESPKLLIGQDTVLLGDDEVSVTGLVASLLGQVARAAARFAGSDVPSAVVLTHPHDWAAHRKAALRAAWDATGIAAREVRLVPEPIAAATWLATESDLPPGATIGVFDYGGGTCDVAVLRRAASEKASWDVLAHGGRADLGGAAIDVILLRWVRATLRRLGHTDVDAALDTDLAALRTLQDEVRHAKEDLSELPDAPISIAVGPHSLSLSITAAEFDELIADEVARARDLTERIIADAGVTPDQLHALYLTGGSSHLRPVHAALADLLGGRPATLGDPKLVVALGAQLVPYATSSPVRVLPADPPAKEARTRRPTSGAEADAATTEAETLSTAARPGRQVFTRPVAAAPDNELVLDLLASLGCFTEPAGKAVRLPVLPRKQLPATARKKPEGFPASLGQVRVLSGWVDLTRLQAAYRSKHPGALERYVARFDLHQNAEAWVFDGTASTPAYVALWPNQGFIEDWNGQPPISPLVLTRDSVSSVRRKRNARWLLSEVDRAVNGGVGESTLVVQPHTGNRYLAQLEGTLEIRLRDQLVDRVTGILT